MQRIPNARAARSDVRTRPRDRRPRAPQTPVTVRVEGSTHELLRTDRRVPSARISNGGEARRQVLGQQRRGSLRRRDASPLERHVLPQPQRLLHHLDLRRGVHEDVQGLLELFVNNVSSQPGLCDDQAPPRRAAPVRRCTHDRPGVPARPSRPRPRPRSAARSRSRSTGTTPTGRPSRCAGRAGLRWRAERRHRGQRTRHAEARPRGAADAARHRAPAISVPAPLRRARHRLMRCWAGLAPRSASAAAALALPALAGLRARPGGRHLGRRPHRHPRLRARTRRLTHRGAVSPAPRR